MEIVIFIVIPLQKRTFAFLISYVKSVLSPTRMKNCKENS